jgi:phosphate transport system substrate-binding protein
MKRVGSILLCVGLMFCASSYAQQNTIHIQGENTLLVLGQHLNELYQRKQPNVTIRVHGGGMEPALSLLSKGEIQIAQAHRHVSSEASHGLVAVPVGIEGIVIYVHESNPVNELSLAQVRSIYLGEVTNWKQVGGRDQRIGLYAGESHTGVIPYFEEYVLRGSEPFGFWGKNSTKDLLDTIAQTPNAMGYSSVGSSPHVKALRIKPAADSPAVEPSIANIRSGQYPISRRIYWYLAHKPQGAVKDFCEWVFSSQGQLVVESIGFQPLTPEERAASMRNLGISSSVKQASSGN